MPAYDPPRRFHMQYVLTFYLDEAGWPKLTKAEQDQGMAAYHAYK